MVNEPSKLPLPVLKKRSEFLAVAKGGRIFRRAFVLQILSRGSNSSSPQRPFAVPTSGEQPPGARIGYTVTKKVGNAVERNRIKRRLRAALRISQDSARPGTDYVLVGRQEALSQSFKNLVADLAESLRSTASAGKMQRRETRQDRRQGVKPGQHPGDKKQPTY